MTRVLVLGATGMLGNAMLRVLADDSRLEVIGAARSAGRVAFLPERVRGSVRAGVDVERDDALDALWASSTPDVVINCVGQVKQIVNDDDPLPPLTLNAVLPHRLARRCRASGGRLVHISTDCVFAGTRGGYRESDVPDATDLYGVSKRLGEVAAPHVTLRTSIIGHELGGSAHGLLEWFLSQRGGVNGFRRAVFSGLPTDELARVVRDHVLPRAGLAGLYHVAGPSISKLDLLQLVAREYAATNPITPTDAPVIDRSLDASRFRDVTGYVAPDWPTLVGRMREFHQQGNQHVRR